jgi:hypothetical protein
MVDRGVMGVRHCLARHPAVSKLKESEQVHAPIPVMSLAQEQSTPPLLKLPCQPSHNGCQSCEHASSQQGPSSNIQRAPMGG